MKKRGRLEFNPKLTESGRIASVKENQLILRGLEKAPALNPRELLSIASRYRKVPAMATLADRLTLNAIRKIVLNKSVTRAVKKIGKEEIDWSIFDDVWNAIVGAVTGSSGYSPPPSEPLSEVYPLYKCFLLVLCEKDSPTSGWRAIGVCFGF